MFQGKHDSEMRPHLSDVTAHPCPPWAALTGPSRDPAAEPVSKAEARREEGQLCLTNKPKQLCGHPPSTEHEQGFRGDRESSAEKGTCSRRRAGSETISRASTLTPWVSGVGTVLCVRPPAHLQPPCNTRPPPLEDMKPRPLAVLRHLSRLS